MCDGEMNVRISANVTLSGLMANLGFNDEIIIIK
jgi:sulfur carrier protein ThiS